MSRVLLATCADLPDGDEDGEILTSALSDHGVDGRWQAWTDTTVDWSADLVVLRSTWDYTLAYGAFLDWARAVPRLANPIDVIVWNSDKTYLRDLSAAAIPRLMRASLRRSSAEKKGLAAMWFCSTRRPQFSPAVAPLPGRKPFVWPGIPSTAARRRGNWRN